MARSIGKERQSANAGQVLAEMAILRSGARFADLGGTELALTIPWPMRWAFRPTIIRNPNKSSLLRILLLCVY
jgi:hypothetical protein